MLNKLLLTLLLKYLDFHKATKDEKVEKWLADSWEHPGGRAYYAIRNEELRDALAGGIGQKETDREQYTRWFGQRMELLIMAAKAKRFSEKYRKERQLTNKQ